MNTVKTIGLMVFMTLLLVFVGAAIGGRSGMIIAFAMATIMNFGSYWFSDKIVLRMYRAQPVSEAEAPELHAIVRTLVQKAGMPMPKVYIIPEDTPNAFATGRNPEHAVVAVTDGLLRLLNREEIRGVLAHELSHVKNRDILIGSIAATLAGVIMMLANMAKWAAIFGGVRGGDEEGGRGGGVIAFLITVIVAPIAAMLIQMAIS